MTQETEKRLPPWARILVAMVVITIVGGTTIAICGVAFTQKIFNESMNPQMISRAVSDIAEFSEPLPKGFKYLFGYSNKFMKPFAIVAVDNSVDKQYLTLMKYRQDTGNTQKLLDSSYEIGFSTPGTYVRFVSIESKGTLQVGGKSVPYIIGKTIDSQDHKSHAIVATLIDPDQKKAFVLYGLQLSDDAYNLAATESLLKTIKSL